VTKFLPSKAKFFLSDDLREEARGKMTLVGLYPDDKMYVEMATQGTVPPGVVAVLSQLTVSCVMFGGAGRFSTDSEIKAPTGQVLVKLAGDQDFNANGTSTLVFRGTSVAIPAYGTFSCTVKVGTKKFLYVFAIVAGPPPGVGGIAQPILRVPKPPRKKQSTRSPKSSSMS
jgi:hypothetical protein